MTDELGTVRQELGRIAGSLDRIVRQLERAEERLESVHAEMRTIKHEARNDDQKVMSVVELLRRDFDSTKNEVVLLASKVSEMAEPVRRVTVMENKVLGAFALLGIMGGAVMFLISTGAQILKWLKGGGL